MDATTIKTGVLAVLASVGSVIANQLGGWDTALVILLCMMAADYVTGIIVALVFHNSPKSQTGKLSSNESFKGLIRKFMVIILIWICAMLDRILSMDYIRTAAILFFVANEGISILENTAIMGVPYPSFIKTALEALKDKNDNAKTPSE